jgi:putative ABC transport system permease protein
MAARISENRQMFWRITRRMLGAHRGRLLVVLLALGAGAAVTAALLNLQVDAKRRLTTEFRTFGTNVVITPPRANADTTAQAVGTLDSALLENVPKRNRNSYGLVAKAALLYGIGQVSPLDSRAQKTTGSVIPAVFVGYQFFGNSLNDIFPSADGPEPKAETARILFGVGGGIHFAACDVGETLAAKLDVRPKRFVEVALNGARLLCYVNKIRHSGGVEDSQIFVPLTEAQYLLKEPGKASMIALNVPGSPSSIEGFISDLRRVIPNAEIQPVRQFTEGEAKIYGRISGLLTATVVAVLVLTSLCVMAAMTNVAMERKNDVGLMKAIGGATRRVLRLFLAEAALLGLAGGLLGAAVGTLLSIWLGKQVFGVAAQPRLIVYPVAVVLTVIVAILSAFPLRRLASVRPASVFRGDA